MAGQTILIVEDDPDIRDGVRILLAGEGYHILEAENGLRALELFNPEVDLVILDIMMPGMSGLRVCEELRKTSAVPILFLTAKSQESDKLLGLTAGGDDYLAKPFGMMEMISRIKAVLRRTTPKEDAPVLMCGGITLNTVKHQVSVHDQPVTLTLKEYELLRTFMENLGKAFTREQLLSSIWGIDFVGETRTVDVHIGTLRTKLGSCGGMITTVRGVGYRMEDTGE